MMIQIDSYNRINADKLIHIGFLSKKSTIDSTGPIEELFLVYYMEGGVEINSTMVFSNEPEAWEYVDKIGLKAEYKEDK